MLHNLFFREGFPTKETPAEIKEYRQATIGNSAEMRASRASRSLALFP